MTSCCPGSVQTLGHQRIEAQEHFERVMDLSSRAGCAAVAFELSATETRYDRPSSLPRPRLNLLEELLEPRGGE